MPTKDEVARHLADRHFAVEDGMTHIFRLTKPGAEDDPAEPIKLLEVNDVTPPCGVMPLHFGPRPARGLPYPMTIVEVTPAEFDQLRAGSLPLPDGWVIGEEFPRYAVAVGA